MTEDHTKRTPGMSPLEVLAEFAKGCTNAGPAYDRMFGKPEGSSSPTECHDCTTHVLGHLEKLLKEMEPGLRAVRLWHWQMAMHYRALQRNDPRQRMKDDFDKQAAWHLSCVQALNDFFPAGDTAERNNDASTVPAS
jgi:hypothetical protein